MYYLYVIQNEAGEYYLGYTANLENRLADHNAGSNKSTKNHKWELVYYEAYVSEKYARNREQALKKNRRMKTILLNRISESLSFLVVR